MSMRRPALPAPVWLAVGSTCVSCAVAWSMGRALPYDADVNAEDLALHRTPERAAENFVAAYGGGDFARASRFSTGELHVRVERMAQGMSNTHEHTNDSRAELVIEQSDFIDDDHLRLSGELLAAGAQEVGKPISLLVSRTDGRFLVQSVEWPLPEPMQSARDR